MEISVTSEELKVGTRNDGSESLCQIVHYEVNGEKGKLTFVDVPKTETEAELRAILDKNVEEAKAEIEKAIANDWKDVVTEIVI